MWVNLRHLANPAIAKKKLWDSSGLLPSALHFKHLVIAGRGILNFDPASLLLLLLVTSLFRLILLLRRSTDTKKNPSKQEQQEINPDLMQVKNNY